MSDSDRLKVVFCNLCKLEKIEGTALGGPAEPFLEFQSHPWPVLNQGRPGRISVMGQRWPRAGQGQNHRWDRHDQRWSQMTSQYGLVFSPLIFTHRDQHFQRFFWQNLKAYKFICAVSKKFNQMSTKKTILHVRQNKFSNCSKKINNFKTLFGLWTKIFRTLTGKFLRFQR